MRLTPRRRLLVDPKLQIPLLFRVVAYWCFTMFAVSQMLIFWYVAVSPPMPATEAYRFDLLWDQYGPAVIASLILLPVFVADAAVVSNRIVGPIYRMRRSMRALAAGEYVKPIEFRGSDFLGDCAKEFNALAEHVEKLEAVVARIEKLPQPAAASDVPTADHCPAVRSVSGPLPSGQAS